MLASWPQLETLKVVGWTFDSHDWMPDKPAPFHLSDLDIDGGRLTDAELAWILSGTSCELVQLVYVEWTDPNNPSPCVTEAGLLKLLFNSDYTLKDLQLGAEALTPAGLHRILANSAHLEALSVPLVSLAEEGLCAAPPSLKELCLYDLAPSDVVTDELTHQALKHLKTCSLAGVRTLSVRPLAVIAIPGFYEKACYQMVRIGRRRGLEVFPGFRHVGLITGDPDF